MKNLFKKIFGKSKKIESDDFLTISDNDLNIPERFSKWIKTIESNDLRSKDIKGLNFGLYETSESYMMYLTGANHFDQDNENWACEIDFEPKYKYLSLNDSTLNDAKWEYVLDYSTKLIKSYLKNNDSFLNKTENITTGFDDGNLTRIK